LTHIFFRKAKYSEGLKQTKFPAIFYPIGNYVCLVFFVAVMVIMWLTGMKVSVELIPIWLLILFVSYKVMTRKQGK